MGYGIDVPKSTCPTCRNRLYRSALDRRPQDAECKHGEPSSTERVSGTETEVVRTADEKERGA